MADLYGHLSESAIAHCKTRTCGDNLTILALFLLFFRKKDTTLGLGHNFGPLDEDAVGEGDESLEVKHSISIFDNKYLYSL